MFYQEANGRRRGRQHPEDPVPQHAAVLRDVLADGSNGRADSMQNIIRDMKECCFRLAPKPLSQVYFFFDRVLNADRRRRRRFRTRCLIIWRCIWTRIRTISPR